MGASYKPKGPPGGRLLVDLGGLPNGVNLREVVGDRQRFRGTVLRQ